MGKLIKTKIVVVAALVVAVHLAVYAVENQTLTVQGTNLVFSWPSRGYESYLIQYRHSLNDEDGWVTLTNAYPANSTTRTTYVVPGVTVPAKTGSGMPVKSAQNQLTPASGISAFSLQPLALMDGAAIPAALYPPSLLAKLTVYDPVSGLTMSGAEFTARQAVQPVPALGGSLITTLGGPVLGGSGGVTPKTPSGSPGSAPETGFYRVFHIPDFAITNMSNYVFGGPIFIPMDFADYQPRVKAITVLVDGQPLQWAQYVNVQGDWGVGIYFNRLTNGLHTIQLVSTLQMNDLLNVDGPGNDILVLSNRVRTITVSNDVSYANWIPFIQGDTYTFKMQLAAKNADWTIYVYDWQNNYVNQGSGHTTNGAVSWTWDLTDYLGNKRDDFYNDTYFNCKIVYDDGNATSNNGPTPKASSKEYPTPPPVQGYPDVGEWLIAYQDPWYEKDADLQDQHNLAMDAVYGGPWLVGAPAYIFRLSFGANSSQDNRDNDWLVLLKWLNDLSLRNFYYSGHGNATSIGGDMHTYDTNGVATGGAFATNSQAYLTSKQVAVLTQYHRYRFVFLDACETANGDWPAAFGVDKVTRETTEYYTNSPLHLRPALFIGWNTKPGGKDWGYAKDRETFNGYWMGNWANSRPNPISIEQSILNANQGANWISRGRLEGALMYYGYKGMKINEYNKKGDWRDP